MRVERALLCVTLLSACAQHPAVPPPGDDRPATDAAAADAAATAPDAITVVDPVTPADSGTPAVSAPADAAHAAPACFPVPCGPRVEEWGTYTSVQASDGHALGGVHHEDERLPAWVHRRDWGADGYYLEQLPQEPLQQLETPVLYFWSPVAQAVQVTVDFPQGVVGQWYPEAEAFVPLLHQMTKLAGGSMSWRLTVDPAVSAASFAPVTAEEIWAPSRRVASTPVRWTAPDGHEEREQFIFYRGLGTFDPPIRIVASDDGQLRISNASREAPPAAFVLRVSEGRGAIVKLGGLDAGATKVAAQPVALDDAETYLAHAHALLEEALVASGLHAEVARAMVDTWSRSWFLNPGLRVLYLAPRPWTDAWLPTTITPPPVAFVRTLVGRIEILTPTEERSLAALVRAQQRIGGFIDPASLGRFAEPRLLRAVEMMGTPDEIAFARSEAETAHRQP